MRLCAHQQSHCHFHMCADISLSRIFTLSHKQPLHRATSKQTNVTSSSSLPSCQVPFWYETSGTVNEERKQTGSLQTGLQKTRPHLAGFPPMNPTRHNLWGHEPNRQLPCREMNPSLLRLGTSLPLCLSDVLCLEQFNINTRRQPPTPGSFQGYSLKNK